MCQTEGCHRAARYKSGHCHRCYSRIKRNGTTVLKPRVLQPRSGHSLWGKNIDALRLQKQVKVTDLCKTTGIDHNTYARLLKDSNVQIKYLVWLAEYFGVDLHTLFIPEYYALRQTATA